MAQTPFKVSNPKDKKFSEAAAQRVYDSAIAVVKGEFALTKAPQPTFTLILGEDRDQIEWVKGERVVHLREWNEFRFADAVVSFAIDAMRTEEVRRRLAARAVEWASATISVEELKK